MIDTDEVVLDLVRSIYLKGTYKTTRNAETSSIFGVTLALDSLEHGVFPIVRARKIFWKGVVGELATFLQGPKSVEHFQANGCNYWNSWAESGQDLELDYGNAWLDFNGVNQLEQVVKSLKEDPNGRRHVISGWRPDRLAELSLPCCHYAYQWYVNGDSLEMIWTQRSLDVMIGLPSDIILAALFNILMAQTVGLKPGKLTFNFGDTHIYDDHLVSAVHYLNRANDLRDLRDTAWPTYSLDEKATVFNFVPSMFSIDDYNPLDAIAFKLFT